MCRSLRSTYQKQLLHWILLVCEARRKSISKDRCHDHFSIGLGVDTCCQLKYRAIVSTELRVTKGISLKITVHTRTVRFMTSKLACLPGLVHTRENSWGKLQSNKIQHPSYELHTRNDNNINPNENSTSTSKHSRTVIA
jgi:hypothetical protein